MNYDSLLQVINNSPTDSYMFAYNSQRWIVKASSRAFIPFEAVTRSLGDPRSGPNPLRITPEGGGHTITVPSRSEELKRLHVLYGTYSEDHAELLAVMPKITAHNMDDDAPIIFPADDPLCSNFSPTETDTSTVAVMQRQLDKMRRQMATMEAIMSGKAPADSEPTSSLPASSDVDEDSPQPLTRPRPASKTG